jgi:hypothetical protein
LGPALGRKVKRRAIGDIPPPLTLDDPEKLKFGLERDFHKVSPITVRSAISNT